ncbi:MAG: nucleotide exchange factor GrpE, partial [Treponema sp.]|nr:nucleotide exchange factor GrpE [Treponema sp.]
MSKHHTREGAASESAQPGTEAAETNAAPNTEGQTGGQDGAGDSAAAPENVSAQNLAGESTEQPVTEPPPEPSPEEKIAALETLVAETKDQLLRKAADFENFRKRMNQEKQNAIDFANQSLLLDIVPVIDDFERAIQAAQSSQDFAALLDGITMIEKRLTSQLESKWGLKRFDSAGEPFDPNRHEALMMEKSADI